MRRYQARYPYRRLMRASYNLIVLTTASYEACMSYPPVKYLLGTVLECLRETELWGPMESASWLWKLKEVWGNPYAGWQGSCMAPHIRWQPNKIGVLSCVFRLLFGVYITALPHFRNLPTVTMRPASVLMATKSEPGANQPWSPQAAQSRAQIRR